jgi:hypothetical protein
LDEKTLVFGKKSALPESLFLTTFFLGEKEGRAKWHVWGWKIKLVFGAKMVSAFL